MKQNNLEKQDDSMIKNNSGKKSSLKKENRPDKNKTDRNKTDRNKTDKNKTDKKKTTEKKNSPMFSGLLSDLSSSAFNYVFNVPVKLGKTIIKSSQSPFKTMVAAGESLRDVREVAGLTVRELSDSLNLKDKSLIEAVENGTATLSFELILRLAALFARNDPVPFIIKYTRTYNPAIWEMLHDWGIGRIPLQFERERQIVNIYRSNDDARKLSDDGFEKVLNFTKHAFQMAIHFVAELEESENDDEKSEFDKEKSESNKEQLRNKDNKSKPIKGKVEVLKEKNEEIKPEKKLSGPEKNGSVE
ncbi:MAG: hypothetical protein B6I31_00275 [Desulfobacteraceae bacterium 4572_19]|nr:MAG: hypothetical protein B6I31_00275 [Desulfobacteraceae bacterium 4572_19]